MESRKQCEFFLIRYVPDTVRGEFVNIGVLLREAAQGAVAASPLVRFTRDWARVRCVDPEVDTEMLEALESELGARLGESIESGTKTMLEILEDSFSNSVQITPARGCLAESMLTEVENLMRVYVDPRRVKGSKKKSGRALIQAAMRSEFERAGVWELMRKQIPTAMYTRPGDPLRIDCAYRPNGLIRMFHGVSLEGDTSLAKVLAYTARGLREGVARIEGAELQLTALIEPIAQIEDEESYRFAVEAMEAGEIRVMTVKDLPRMAETAKRELLRA